MAHKLEICSKPNKVTKLPVSVTMELVEVPYTPIINLAEHLLINLIIGISIKVSNVKVT